MVKESGEYKGGILSAGGPGEKGRIGEHTK